VGQIQFSADVDSSGKPGSTAPPVVLMLCWGWLPLVRRGRRRRLPLPLLLPKTAARLR
jgi:hypothetical protein